MMQPIVVKSDSLARGIEQAGGALGQVLMQKAQESRQEDKYRKTSSLLDEGLSKLPPNPSAIDIQKMMTNISQQKGVDQQFLNQSFHTLMPLYQERMKSSEGLRYLQQVFPNSQMFGGEQAPIEQAIPQQNQRMMFPSEGLMSSPETMQPQYMQTPSNLEQLPMMQQSQPQQQENLSPSAKYDIESPGLGNVNRSQIDALLISPYESMRRLGESLDKRWTEQYKLNSQENADIRKEYRQQINEYSKPYQEVSKLETNLNKLKEAEKLIDSGKVSIDDQWLRNATVGILEGRESPLGEMIKTPEQQKLWFLLKDSLRTKDIGGSNPSTKEVLLSLSSQPGPYKSQAANKYMIRNMVNQAEIELNKANEISKLRERGGPISFAKFQSEIDKASSTFSEAKQKELQKEMTFFEAKESIRGKKASPGTTWMIDPEGIPRQVPTKDIKRAQDAGGTLLK